MSGMTDRKLLGLPFSGDGDAELSAEAKADAKEQKKELEGFGLKVTGIHLIGEGAPLRFFIEFPKNEPSYKIRGALTAHNYDVGQQMGEKILRFYASRRAVRGEGWQV